MELKKVKCFDDLKEINVYICILCLIGLWTRSPNMEVDELKFRSVFKCFLRFCKFGKVRKTEETLADFPEKKKSKCWKRKEKEIFFSTSLPHYF